jgi:TonB family protein
MRFNRALVLGLAAFALGAVPASAVAQGTATQGAYRPGAGIQNPTEVTFTEPKYTQAAIDARIQGPVVLEAVIDTAGKVRNVRVVQSLDAKYGLDQEAIKAVQQWEFRPATKDNTPVPMIVSLEVMFRLPKEPPVRQAVVARPPQEPIKLPDDGFAAGAYAEDTAGLVMPKATRQIEPKYTSDAMRAKIQGVVVVEVVIGTDGTIAKARVFESLDKTYGLDDSALAAVRTWTFEPGTLSGRVVPVYARLEVMFRLH